MTSGAPANGDGAGARTAALAAMRDGERFVLATHEGPDGDALGSLVGMHRLLRALGKDSVMFMAPEELPLPYEYRFIDLDGLVTEAPADIDDRTVVFLDCGNIDRNPADALKRAAQILNVDHHHDNTRFGTVDLVDPGASCTAEIVWELMGELGMSPSVEMAEVLYVGLVTDTGRFMYENTGPRAHEMAAALIAAGVDVEELNRRLYEGVPQAKLDLLVRGLARTERHDGGLLTMTCLTQADYAETGAEEAYSEGIVDHLRALEGTAVAALVRDRVCERKGSGARKVSLRAVDGRVDVSAIARQKGGGGHRRAAGFSTEMEWEAIVAFLRVAVVDALAVSA